MISKQTLQMVDYSKDFNSQIDEVNDLVATFARMDTTM